MRTTGWPGCRSGPEMEAKSWWVPMETSEACEPLFQSISDGLAIVESEARRTSGERLEFVEDAKMGKNFDVDEWAGIDYSARFVCSGV